MSIWYRDGTVAITTGAKVVTGTDTLWKYAGILDEGDIFTIDNIRLYEIESVDSDTQITLTENYAGSTVTAAPYSIIPNYAVRPEAPIIGRQMLLINKWLIREQELFEWQTAPADEFNPTYVDLHAWNGEVSTYKSLPQIISEIGTTWWNDVVGKPANIEAWGSIDPATKQNASANLNDWSTTTLASMASKAWTTDAFNAFEAPDNGKLYGRKNKAWAEVKRHFPFFNAAGNSAPIAFTADDKLPFVRADGTSSNISVIP